MPSNWGFQSILESNEEQKLKIPRYQKKKKKKNQPKEGYDVIRIQPQNEIILPSESLLAFC